IKASEIPTPPPSVPDIDPTDYSASVEGEEGSGGGSAGGGDDDSESDDEEWGNNGEIVELDPYIVSPGTFDYQSHVRDMLESMYNGFSNTAHAFSEAWRITMEAVKEYLQESGDAASDAFNERIRALQQERQSDCNNFQPGANQTMAYVALTTAESKILQDGGQVRLGDGRVVKMGYQGNQYDPSSMVQLAKNKQLVLLNINKGAGYVGGALTLSGMVGDTMSYVEGDMSGARYSYHMAGNLISFAGPPGTAVASAMFAYEFGYDALADPLMDYTVNDPNFVWKLRNFLCGGRP
ncbi:MAG: hypothetical protein MI748_03150, partial [Opitutales bacterium]|nr:hypothetical protein [Opitutales bacterium]